VKWVKSMLTSLRSLGLVAATGVNRTPPRFYMSSHNSYIVYSDRYDISRAQEISNRRLDHRRHESVFSQPIHLSGLGAPSIRTAQCHSRSMSVPSDSHHSAQVHLPRLASGSM
jgi:hypothetical protein